MKTFFPTAGTPNLATYCWVISLMPAFEAGNSPIRVNLLHTMTPAVRGREAETMTPTAWPKTMWSLSTIRPAWLVITSRADGVGQMLSDSGGLVSRSCPKANRWKLALKNNLRPLRRRRRAARLPLRLVRASTSHASRCSSVRTFHAAANMHISVRARRWSGVGALLRARAFCFLLAIAADPTKRRGCRTVHSQALLSMLANILLSLTRWNDANEIGRASWRER